MYNVYIIQNEKYGYYIGLSDNVSRRLAEHNQGKVPYMSRFSHWTLVYYEAYLDRALARHREVQLKKRSSAYVALMKRLNLK